MGSVFQVHNATGMYAVLHAFAGCLQLLYSYELPYLDCLGKPPDCAACSCTHCTLAVGAKDVAAV